MCVFWLHCYIKIRTVRSKKDRIFKQKGQFLKLVKANLLWKHMYERRRCRVVHLLMIFGLIFPFRGPCNTSCPLYPHLRTSIGPTSASFYQHISWPSSGHVQTPPTLASWPTCYASNVLLLDSSHPNEDDVILYPLKMSKKMKQAAEHIQRKRTVWRFTTTVENKSLEEDELSNNYGILNHPSLSTISPPFFPSGGQKDMVSVCLCVIWLKDVHLHLAGG